LKKSDSVLRVVENLQIKDVESLPDMDNSVRQSFDNHLLKLEASVHSCCP